MMPRHLLIVTMTVLILALAGLAGAGQPSEVVKKFDSKVELEMDLDAMIDDLMPLLDEALAGEEDDDLTEMRALIDLLGLQSLETLHAKSESKKDGGWSRMTLTIDADKETGLLGELLALPAGECDFAEYLDRDDLTMVASLQNFAAHLDLVLDVLNRPEFAELTGEMPRNGQGEIELEGFCPRRDLLPLLSGELDIVLLDMPDMPGDEPFNPMTMPVYLVLGSENGLALRDLILDTVQGFAGEEGAGMVEMIRSLPAETVGDFELTETPFGGAYAVSGDFLVLGIAGAPLRTLLAGKNGDLDVPEGRTWAYMDGRKYGRAMEAFSRMSGAMGGMQAEQDAEAEWMMDLYSNLFGHLESETVRTWTRPDRLVVEADVQGNMMQGLYAMLYSFMLDLPEIVEKKRAESARFEAVAGLNDAVSELDAAFTAYAANHDGHYPADARELVAEGYLEEFPLEMAVPAGTYIEGAYTYHPLPDANGDIVGYYLFVYGGGEGTGYDVYTPENLEAGDAFTIGSDGQPDGVASFCYDGIALDQIEDW